MPTNSENLETAIAAVLTALAAGAGTPNYSIDGQSVDRNSLLQRLDGLMALRTPINGPFETETIGEA